MPTWYFYFVEFYEIDTRKYYVNLFCLYRKISKILQPVFPTSIDIEYNIIYPYSIKTVQHFVIFFQEGHQTMYSITIRSHKTVRVDHRHQTF